MSDAQLETESAKQETTGKKTKAKSEKKKKTTGDKIALYNNLVKIIDGLEHPWGTFPRKFLIARDKKGHALWLEKNSDDVVWDSSKEAVCETLKKYLDSIPGAAAQLEPHQIPAVADYWAWSTNAINLEDVSIIQQKSEKGLTWNRLVFDFSPGATPYWDEILSRMENNEAFLAWFGSLFETKSDRVQYVWLSGAGDNSKGVIIEMLSHLFGVDRGFKTAEPWKHQPSQFWRRTILGARVICFNECNDTKFVQTEGFKSLTGDRHHPIEGKFTHIFSAELNCKILIASNEQAEISREHSEVKRLIPCPMKQIDAEKYIPLDLLKSYLTAELPAFCHKALEMYRKKCPNFGRIHVSSDITDDWVEKSEERFQALFDRYFKADPIGYISHTEMHDFRNREDVRMNSNQEFGKFKKFLSHKDVVRVRETIGDKKVIKYQGISKSAMFTRVTTTLESVNALISPANGNGSGAHY